MTSFITSVSPQGKANTADSTCHCQVEGHRSSTAEHPLLKPFHTTTLWKHDKAGAALPPFSKWQCSLTLLKPNQIQPKLVLGSPTAQQLVPISAVPCHIPGKMFLCNPKSGQRTDPTLDINISASSVMWKWFRFKICHKAAQTQKKNTQKMILWHSFQIKTKLLSQYLYFSATTVPRSRFQTFFLFSSLLNHTWSFASTW